MTGARTDRTRWMRDQLIAAVREHPGSATQQIVDAIRGQARRESGGTAPIITWVTYSQVYSALRSLDKLGLVRWQSWIEGSDLVRWWPVDQPDDGLEVLASLPCVEPTRGERG